MANYSYKFSSADIQSIIELDSYTSKDKLLIDEFEINSNFDQTKDFIELHYYSLDGRLLKSLPFYTNIQAPQDSEIVNANTLSALTLRVEDDLVKGGYNFGDVYLHYNFLSNPFSRDPSNPKFFIEEISPDRTEIRLLATNLDSSDIIKGVESIKADLEENKISEFLLNLENNRLLLSVNIDTLVYKDSTSIVIKLYNELPEDITVKDLVSVNIEVSNPTTYLAEAEIIPEEVKVPYIKGPNFNIEVNRNTSQPTEYFNSDQVLNYPVTNSYYEVQSLLNEKGAQLSIDYSDYINFINFSSAKERLENFQYKLNLISTYQSASNSILNSNYTEIGITGSKAYYEDLINGIVQNFDHYDRYLYFESSSFSWPKTNSTRPFIPATGSATGSWYSTQHTSASTYDSTNPNQLLNTIPEFIREDSNNAKYSTFLNMIGQHFDNLWIYSKALTDKYDGDNRLNSGLSKDLIEDALKNFGIKLYSSNKTTQELFQMFTGETYDTGSESYVTEIISGSDDIISEDNYRKSIYKRLYHNLPFLLKSKGTERGLRALFATFGLPSLYTSGSHSGLKLQHIGGTLSGSFNLGGTNSTTSSLDRIRIDNTGSLIPSASDQSGYLLSQFTSIVKRDSKYTNDSNITEAGFSPATYLNEFIIASASTDNFNLDEILGDPRLSYSSSYDGLHSKAKEYLTPVTGSQYNLKDFTRLLKFYDNVLFKSIKDFIPARTNISSGVVIKPHLLERSKIKQVELKSKEYEHLTGSYDISDTGSLSQVKKHFIGDISVTGSIEIGIRSGSHGDSFGSRDQYNTSYTSSIITSGGLATKENHNHEEAKYDGEFSGSYIKLSSGELNISNTYKYANTFGSSFYLAYVSSSENAPTPSPTPSITPTPSIAGSPLPTPTPTVTPSSSPPTISGVFSLIAAYGRYVSYMTVGGGDTLPDFDFPTNASENQTMVDSYASGTNFNVEFGTIATAPPGTYKAVLKVNGVQQDCAFYSGGALTLTTTTAVAQADNIAIEILVGSC